MRAERAPPRAPATGPLRAPRSPRPAGAAGFFVCVHFYFLHDTRQRLPLVYHVAYKLVVKIMSRESNGRHALWPPLVAPVVTQPDGDNAHTMPHTPLLTSTTAGNRPRGRPSHLRRSP